MTCASTSLGLADTLILVKGATHGTTCRGRLECAEDEGLSALFVRAHPTFRRARTSGRAYRRAAHKRPGPDRKATEMESTHNAGAQVFGVAGLSGRSTSVGATPQSIALDAGPCVTFSVPRYI
jgi:hypothetical protein